MNRTFWKWLLGISIGLQVLLFLLTIGFWILFNIGGGILLTMMGNIEIHAVPFSAFMSNFVGSPMFYICIADLAVLLSSIIALILTRAKNKQRDGKTAPYNEETNYES